MQADHTDAPAGCDYATVYFAFELSKSKWQPGWSEAKSGEVDARFPGFRFAPSGLRS